MRMTDLFGEGLLCLGVEHALDVGFDGGDSEVELLGDRQVLVGQCSRRRLELTRRASHLRLLPLHVLNDPLELHLPVLPLQLSRLEVTRQSHLVGEKPQLNLLPQPACTCIVHALFIVLILDERLRRRGRRRDTDLVLLNHEPLTLSSSSMSTSASCFLRRFSWNLSCCLRRSMSRFRRTSSSRTFSILLCHSATFCAPAHTYSHFNALSLVTQST